MPGMITGRLKSWAFESWWWKARPAPRSSTTHATGARGRTMDLKQAHILVTPTSYGKHDARLKAELESRAGSVTYNPTGKPLSSHAVAVAELAIGLILALARQIPEAEQAVRHGTWPRLDGISLEGKSVGILGLGTIGKELARRLAGFDCHILAYDHDPDEAFAAAHDIALESLDAVIANSDVVSLHLPLLPATRGLVNREFLAKMKRGAILVNTSRGRSEEPTAELQS